MSAINDPWIWTAEREKAAQLVAVDQLSDSEIAAEVGVQKITVERWKRIPAFRARVHEHLAEVRKVMLKHTITETENQIAFLASRMAAMRGVVRATGRRNTDAPGESVVQRGIQLRTEKAIGSGDNQRFVVEFALNTELLAAERDTIEEIATLTGKWRRKIEHGGRDGQPITISVAEVLRNRRARRLAAATPALAGATVEVNATAAPAADSEESV